MADNIDLLAGKILALTDALATPAANAALEAARMEAYAALSGGGIALVVATASAWGTRKLWLFSKSDDCDYEVETGVHVVMVLLGIIAVVASLIGVWSFADPRTWSTIAHPELWLAKRFLGL